MRVHDGLLICTYYDGAYLELSCCSSITFCWEKSFSLVDFLLLLLLLHFWVKLFRSLHELIGKLWFLTIAIVYGHNLEYGRAFYRCSIKHILERLVILLCAQDSIGSVNWNLVSNLYRFVCFSRSLNLFLIFHVP